MRCNDTLKKRDATARKEAYKEHFKHIIATKATLQFNWENEQARLQLSHAQQTLHQLRMEKQDRWKTELDIQWNSVGDTCSREFFESLKIPDQEPH